MENTADDAFKALTPGQPQPDLIATMSGDDSMESLPGAVGTSPVAGDADLKSTLPPAVPEKRPSLQGAQLASPSFSIPARSLQATKESIVTRTVGKVSVSMRARRVYDVNTVDETFGVLLHLIFMWELPPWETPPKDGLYLRDETPDWVPNFRIKQVQELVHRETQYRLIPASVPGAKDMVLAEDYVQVTLFEPMDLTLFPVDCQGLTVDLELKQDIFEAELVPFEDGTPLADVLVDRCFLKDFRLMKMPRLNENKSRFEVMRQSLSLKEGLFSADVGDDDHPDGPRQMPFCSFLGLTDKSNSRFGKQFSRLLLRIHVQRSSEFYLTNVAIILFGVTTLAFSTMAYVPTDLTGRHTIDFTLILTAVAFKLTVSQLIPAVSYLTLLDKYVMTSFLVLAALTLYHAFIPYILGGVAREAYNGPVGLNLQDDNYPTASREALEKMEKLDTWVMTSVGGVWILYNVWWFVNLHITRYLHRIDYLSVAQAFNTSDIDMDMHAMMKRLHRTQTMFAGKTEAKHKVKNLRNVVSFVKAANAGPHNA